MRVARPGFVIAVTAALVAAVFVWAGLTLPPGAKRVPEEAWQPSRGGPSARGVFHIHTTLSDGTGSPDEVAAAAARAGHRFVVFTDHGDGTRPPDPPRYSHGVLCLDGVEISTSSGHYAVAGMRQSPYPLAGEARDVVEDVRRLGGFGVAAHPTSPREELRWRDAAARPDALEWLNVDTEWRDERWLALVPRLAHYLARGEETVASVFDRPAGALQLWDRMLRQGRMTALIGADAHARLGFRHEENHPGRAWLALPSYEAVFGALGLHVALERPLTGEAAVDAGLVLDGLRAGRVFSSIDAIRYPAGLEFEATSAGSVATAGGSLESGPPVTLRVAVPALAGITIALFENGEVVEEAESCALERTVAGSPAVYRVEVGLAGAPGDPPVPWIVSNPIYVGAPLEGPRPAISPEAASAELIAVAGERAAWRVERDGRSRGAFDVREDGEAAFEFRFEVAGAGDVPSPFVAVARQGAPPAGFDRLAFRGFSDRPMRISIQLRRAEKGEGLRWQRSVYLDETPREVVVPFDDMRAIPPAGDLDAGSIGALLFVVDGVNTLPGTSGTIHVERLRWERQTVTR